MLDDTTLSTYTVLGDTGGATVEEQRGQWREGEKEGVGAPMADEGDETKLEPGKFSLLMDAPVEVFLEILSYSTPPELLELSLVNKAMHELLTAPSAEAKRFWKQARENDELPDLRVADFTQMQYASLVYGEGCMVCRDKIEGVRVDYYISMRLCEDCRETVLDHEVNIEQRFEGLHPSTLECTPFTVDDPSYCDIDDTHYFYKPALHAMSEKLVVMQVAADKVEGPATEAPDDPRNVLTAFIRDRTELVGIASLDGQDLFRWEEEAGERRYYENNERRAQRVRLIKAHLVDLGFDARDCSFETKENEEFLQHLEPLSTVAFSLALPSLIAELSLNTSRRLEHESSQRARARSDLLLPFYDEMLAARSSRLEKAVFPPFVVFLVLPSVEGFWFPDPDSEAGEEIGFDRKAWEAARQQILTEVKALAHSDTLLHLLSLARAAQLQPNAEQLFSPFPAFSFAIASNWTPHPLLGSLLPGHSPLPSIAEANRALSAPFARWLCIAPTCQAAFRYTELRVHQHEEHAGRTTEGLMSSTWIEVLASAMKQARVEDDEGLKKVGEVFECCGEECAEDGDGQGPRRMRWNELVKHLVLKHLMWFRGWEKPEVVVRVVSA